MGPGEEGVSFQAAHSAGDFYRKEWQRTFNQTAGTFHFPLPPMASYRRGPVEQGLGIGPSALGEATLDQARLETAALHPPQPMQESKPFVALAKTENGWVFEMSEVPLPYPLYQTGVRVWLAPCTTLEFI